MATKYTCIGMWTLADAERRAQFANRAGIPSVEPMTCIPCPPSLIKLGPPANASFSLRVLDHRDAHAGPFCCIAPLFDTREALENWLYNDVEGLRWSQFASNWAIVAAETTP
jgi:hypothetical protein